MPETDDRRPLPHLTVREIVGLAYDADLEHWERMAAGARTPHEKRMWEERAKQSAAERRRILEGEQ